MYSQAISTLQWNTIRYFLSLWDFLTCCFDAPILRKASSSSRRSFHLMTWCLCLHYCELMFGVSYNRLMEGVKWTTKDNVNFNYCTNRFLIRFYSYLIKTEHFCRLIQGESITSIFLEGHSNVTSTVTYSPLLKLSHFPVFFLFDVKSIIIREKENSSNIISFF